MSVMDMWFSQGYEDFMNQLNGCSDQEKLGTMAKYFCQ